MSDKPADGARPPESDEELASSSITPRSACAGWVPTGASSGRTGPGWSCSGAPSPSTSATTSPSSSSSRETAADILGRLARGETVIGYETGLRTKDGSIRQVLIGAKRPLPRRPVRPQPLGHPRHHRASWRGSRPRGIGRRTTSHLKDEFLALLSHELRTPLGAILVWLGLLRQGGFDPAETDRALEIIERSARTLERIIEDLLHASRIAAGGLMLNPQLVDLRGVVQVAVDAASGDAAHQGPVPHVGARGDTDLGEGGPGPAAAGRVQPAVERHQVHAGRRPGRGVPGHRRTSRPGSASPTRGEGMSPAFLPFAFERFRQQDSTSTRAHHGLGLGLYVVRHVIGHHGGVVSAESPGPGPGQHVHGAASAGGGAGRGARALRAPEPPSQSGGPPSGRASRSCSSTTRRTHARP